MFSLARSSLNAARRAASGNSLKLATRTMSSDSVTFDLTGSFQLHNLDTAPNNEITMTKEELLEHFRLMYTMRRMEITCDNEYKARNIRGFCHLYDGQEAVATGINAAFEPEDSWITSYRCHCISLARGGNVQTFLRNCLETQEDRPWEKEVPCIFTPRKITFMEDREL
jgi:pyruvate dehydrogenase E1 component alpha subunit